MSLLVLTSMLTATTLQNLSEDRSHLKTGSRCFHAFFFFILIQGHAYWFWRGRKGERGRETSMWERNIDWLPLSWALPGTKPTTQAQPMTLWFTGWRSSWLNHTSQGCFTLFKNIDYWIFPKLLSQNLPGMSLGICMFKNTHRWFLLLENLGKHCFNLSPWLQSCFQLYNPLSTAFPEWTV